MIATYRGEPVRIVRTTAHEATIVYHGKLRRVHRSALEVRT